MLLPVAFALANLLIIAASWPNNQELRPGKPISDSFMWQLCSEPLPLDHMRMLLKSYANKEDVIDGVSVHHLLVMESAEYGNCQHLVKYKINCGALRDSCFNIRTYCTDRYQKLEPMCSPEDHPKDVAPPFNWWLENIKLDPSVVAEMLQGYPGERIY